MSKPNLILIGAGGHARACIDAIEQEGIYKIAGLIGLAQEVGSKHFGYEVIATDSEIPELVVQYQFALITAPLPMKEPVPIDVLPLRIAPVEIWQ